MGLRQPEIFSGLNSAPLPMPNSKKYERSGLAPEKAEEHSAKLIHCMETAKPFKNAELTLQELAAQLSIPPNHLSQVINDKLGQNFFDFINGYRVKEAQQALRDPAKQHLTILAIAYEAGFNSKSAFNAAFKKHTDMTPSQFKKTSQPARQDDFSA
jgi:AraC-like DNA-binding protein